jgi:Flp pilus assembly protein TadD
LSPDLLQAHNNLAVAHLQLGDAPAAVDVCHQILARNDRFAPAHYNLAVAYRILGETENARHHYHEARSLGYPADEEMENL